MDIRCDNGIKFGEVLADVLEVKCRSARCGHGPGVVVIHRFSLVSGELLKTERFRDISSRKEGQHNDNSSLRSA